MLGPCICNRRFLQLNPTSDDKLIYLQESSSLNTLDVMKKSFSEGSLDPYSIIVSGGGKNSVFTQVTLRWRAKSGMGVLTKTLALNRYEVNRFLQMLTLGSS